MGRSGKRWERDEYGGSPDRAENSLFDLQAVAVQMVMLRLDALMG